MKNNNCKNKNNKCQNCFENNCMLQSYRQGILDAQCFCNSQSATECKCETMTLTVKEANLESISQTAQTQQIINQEIASKINNLKNTLMIELPKIKSLIKDKLLHFSKLSVETVKINPISVLTESFSGTALNQQIINEEFVEGLNQEISDRMNGDEDVSNQLKIYAENKTIKKGNFTRTLLAECPVNNSWFEVKLINNQTWGFNRFAELEFKLTVETTVGKRIYYFNLLQGAWRNMHDLSTTSSHPAWIIDNYNDLTPAFFIAAPGFTHDGPSCPNCRYFNVKISNATEVLPRSVKMYGLNYY